jgi:hypothetical protein
VPTTQAVGGVGGVQTSGAVHAIGQVLPLIQTSQSAGGAAGVGVSGQTHVAGAQATRLATTGSGPAAAEGFLGVLLLAIGSLLLKPRRLIRRLFQ